MIHRLQYREFVHFQLPPLILRLYTGCRLGQTLSKCIASFKKSKSAKMLRMGVLFISKTLSYSFCACVRNTPNIVSFVIRKMKLVSFSLFLDAFPPRPKMHFTYVVNVYSDMSLSKRYLRSRGGKALLTISPLCLVELFVFMFTK